MIKQKSNFDVLFDEDFFNSEARILELWNIDYDWVLNDFRNSSEELDEMLENFNKTWYTLYKHYESDSMFVDKEGLAIYNMREAFNDNFLFDSVFHISELVGELLIGL